MADKKELNTSELEEVAGGMNPKSVSPEEWERLMNGPYKNQIESKPEIAPVQNAPVQQMNTQTNDSARIS